MREVQDYYNFEILLFISYNLINSRISEMKMYYLILVKNLRYDD